MTSRLALAVLAACALSACGPSKEHLAVDSTSAISAQKEKDLGVLLAAQKDSLTRIVLEADSFISHIDSSMSSVRGLGKRGADRRLDPVARSIETRKLLMARVDSLVARARATAAQLASQGKANAALVARIADDSALIADLNTNIKRQDALIAVLGSRVDSLRGATQQLTTRLASTTTALTATTDTLVSVQTAHNKAYYLIGREDDLVKRGVVTREGGANLLFAHPGRTLQIARELDAAQFVPVDQRNLSVIAVPDSTRRYRVISRQSLDHAQVADREENSFRGNLKIVDAAQFWGSSRYLVLVEM